MVYVLGPNKTGNEISGIILATTHLALMLTRLLELQDH